MSSPSVMRVCKAGLLALVSLAAVPAPVSAQAPAPPAPPSRPELVVQTGHTFAVNVVTFGPDGRLLASGGWDGMIKIWDLTTGLEVRTFTGYKSVGSGLAFSPDGQWLAAASEGDIKVWEIVTGRVVRVLAGHTDMVNSVKFSPDGTLVASCSSDGSVRLWDVTGRERLQFRNHNGAVWALAFTSDGHWLASAGEDKTIKIWETSNGREVHSIPTGETPAGSLSFMTGKKLLAWGTRDGSIRLWHATGGERTLADDGHVNGVLSVVSGRDGERLISGGADNKVKVWNVSTGRQELSFEAYSGAVSGVPVHFIMSVAVSPDGLLIASGSSDKTIELWDAATGRELRTLTGRTDRIPSVAFSPDGRWLASGGETKDVKLWDLANGTGLRALSGLAIQVSTVAFSPDGRWLAAGGGGLKLWEVSSGRKVRTLVDFAAKTTEEAVEQAMAGKAPAAGVGTVAFISNNRLLALVGTELKVFDTATGNEDSTFSAPGSLWGVLALSPDARLLAIASIGGVKLWDPATGREITTLPDGSGRPDKIVSSNLAFSPDGHWLASIVGSELTVWDTATSSVLISLDVDERSISLAFSPDGQLLAVGGAESIKVLEVPTGRELRTMSGHSGAVSSMTFGPDGRLLASGGEDSSVRVWDPITGEPLVLLSATWETADWIAVTPGGLFDGSPAGMQKLVGWRLGIQTASPEIFFNEFYYPGLLAEIFQRKRPKAPRDISQIDRRQPGVKLSVLSGQGSAVGGRQTAQGTISERSVTVRIDVAEAAAAAQRPTGSGVRDLRLFRNGSLVKVWRGDLSLNESGKVVLEGTVPIVAGENRFTAYAFNHDNIKSADATLTVTGAESLRRKGTAYILAIGINQYANPDYHLNYAVPDARAFADELQRQQQALGQYEKVEVISLLDADATKSNVLAALRRLAGDKTAGSAPALEKIQQAQPEDAVFVYYAGHGTAAGDRFYLIPHDLGYAGKREEIDEAGLQTLLAHSIDDRELEKVFEPIDAGQILLVIDACNSGQALEAEEKRRGPMNSKGLAQLAYEKGMYILTAAQGYQAALEVAQLGHGLLTYALVEEGLKTPAADEAPKDGQVVIREWLDYATQRVPQLQTGALEQARKARGDADYSNAAAVLQEMEQQLLQRPRVFYRREPEAQPLVVAKPGT